MSVPISEKLEAVKLLRVITAHECASLLNKVDRHSGWTAATSPNSDSSEVDRSSFDAEVLLEIVYREEFKQIRERLEAYFSRWLDTQAKNCFILSSLVMVRYRAGGHLGVHADATVNHNRFRRYSIVLYLNREFKGGATSFLRLRKSWRPAEGEALFFPSSYIHCGEPVQDGVKYVIIAFLCDPKTVPEVF